MSTGEKFLQLLIVIGLFLAVMAVVLVLTSRVRSRVGEMLQTTAFLLPAVLLLALGLLYPAIRTVIESFRDRTSSEWVGLANYEAIFTDDALLQVLRNTAIWVLVTPVLATVIGLVYAVLVDRARFERFAKALMFMPMAISLVGASLIWRFVYSYRETDAAQIGVLNQLLKSLGFETYRFISTEPWNTLFLVVVMIWVQAGFAMTILSAAIKAIPDDIVEAARLDGLGGVQMFRYITVPSIRPALIVVLTTIAMATLKVFDIVRTMTAGNFGTSVVANEFYTQSFRYNDKGLGATLAVILFVLVIPLVIYNVRQMRKVEEIR